MAFLSQAGVTLGVGLPLRTMCSKRDHICEQGD